MILWIDERRRDKFRREKEVKEPQPDAGKAASGIASLTAAFIILRPGSTVNSLVQSSKVR